MEPNSVTAELSAAAAFEPRDSRESFLASRGAFTSDDLERVARASDQLLGAETAHRALHDKLEDSAPVGSAPKDQPRTKREIGQSRIRQAVPLALMATVASGVLSWQKGSAVRDDMMAPIREAGLVPSPTHLDNVGRAARQVTLDHFGNYSLAFGGVALAAFGGLRWMLRRRDVAIQQQHDDYAQRVKERAALSYDVQVAGSAVVHAKSAYEAVRADVVAEAESRVDDEIWRSRCEDVGYEIARVHPSASGLLYRSRQGFTNAEVAYLDSVDRRRCGLLMGKAFLTRELSVEDYQLVLEGLNLVDPPAADGSTRRGRLFLEVTRGPDRHQLDSFRINELLLARARGRDQFVGDYDATRGPFLRLHRYSSTPRVRHSNRLELVEIFDGAFRHLMIAKTGKPRPVGVRMPSGLLLRKAAGFTTREIEELKIDDGRRQSELEWAASRAAAEVEAREQAQRERLERLMSQPSPDRNALFSTRAHSRVDTDDELQWEEYRQNDLRNHGSNLGEAQRMSYWNEASRR